MSLRSRIDFWLIPHATIQYVSDISICYAPLSDHKAISLRMVGNKLSSGKVRGYWKFNNSLLTDDTFKGKVKMFLHVLEDTSMSYTQRWEYFKFKIRELAIKRSKEIKTKKYERNLEVITELNSLLTKSTLSTDEQTKLHELQLEIDHFYVDLAKGAFVRSRAKWLEEGKKTQVIFLPRKRGITNVNH